MIRPYALVLCLILTAAFIRPAAAQTVGGTNNYQWTTWQTIGTGAQTYAATRSLYPNNEFGLRYFSSSGGISYNLENPKISRLDYKVTSSVAGETYFRLASRNERYIFKGLLGLGGEQSGTVEDFDYNADGSTGSDTTSQLKNGRLLYVSADIGYKLNFLSPPKAATSFLAGLGYYQDVMTGHGLVCNQAGTPGPPNYFSDVCPSAGTAPEPNSVKVLQNEAEFSALRIGLENNYQPTRRLTWRNEIILIPYANFTNNDSHYLRTDLGTEQPNVRDFGAAYGAQFETLLDFRISPRWSLNIGGRYWEFWAPETKTKYGNSSLSSDNSYSWKYIRAGVFAGASYRF